MSDFLNQYAVQIWEWGVIAFMIVMLIIALVGAKNTPEYEDEE